MTDRQFHALRRSGHAGQNAGVQPHPVLWVCRRSSDRAARDADIRREDVLLELLDDAHRRIRELEATLERLKAHI
jgi:hypothetical protein